MLLWGPSGSRKRVSDPHSFMHGTSAEAAVGEGGNLARAGTWAPGSKIKKKRGPASVDSGPSTAAPPAELVGQAELIHSIFHKIKNKPHLENTALVKYR